MHINKLTCRMSAMREAIWLLLYILSLFTQSGTGMPFYFNRMIEYGFPAQAPAPPKMLESIKRYGAVPLMVNFSKEDANFVDKIMAAENSVLTDKEVLRAFDLFGRKGAQKQAREQIFKLMDERIARGKFFVSKEIAEALAKNKFVQELQKPDKMFAKTPSEYDYSDLPLPPYPASFTEEHYYSPPSVGIPPFEPIYDRPTLPIIKISEPSSGDSVADSSGSFHEEKLEAAMSLLRDSVDSISWHEYRNRHLNIKAEITVTPNLSRGSSGLVPLRRNAPILGTNYKNLSSSAVSISSMQSSVSGKNSLQSPICQSLTINESILTEIPQLIRTVDKYNKIYFEGINIHQDNHLLYQLVHSKVKELHFKNCKFIPKPKKNIDATSPDFFLRVTTPTTKLELAAGRSDFESTGFNFGNAIALRKISFINCNFSYLLITFIRSIPYSIESFELVGFEGDLAVQSDIFEPIFMWKNIECIKISNFLTQDDKLRDKLIYLGHSKFLKHLDLSHNPIGDIFSEAIQFISPVMPIKTLILRNVAMNEDGIAKLIKCIPESLAKLELIDLRENYISADKLKSPANEITKLQMNEKLNPLMMIHLGITSDEFEKLPINFHNQNPKINLECSFGDSEMEEQASEKKKKLKWRKLKKESA